MKNETKDHVGTFWVQNSSVTLCKAAILLHLCNQIICAGSVTCFTGQQIQDPLPTLLFLRLPLCCFCDPLCCFCGPLCWNVFPFCWFGDPFCCFWSAKWECVLPKCHPPSRMLILYLSRINNCGPSKAKNQQFLSNKTESTNCIDQSLVGSFQDLQMIALWKLSLRRRQSSISHSILLSFLSLL